MGNGLVVAFARLAEFGGGEVFCWPDVGTHEEAAGEGTWVVGGDVGADVETLEDVFVTRRMLEQIFRF